MKVLFKKRLNLPPLSSPFLLPLTMKPSTRFWGTGPNFFPVASIWFVDVVKNTFGCLFVVLLFRIKSDGFKAVVVSTGFSILNDVLLKMVLRPFTKRFGLEVEGFGGHMIFSEFVVGELFWRNSSFDGISFFLTYPSNSMWTVWRVMSGTSQTLILCRLKLLKKAKMRNLKF